MTAIAVVDLPEPDSPTIASVSPAPIDRLASCTAVTVPSWVVNWTCRPETSSSGFFASLMRVSLVDSD